MCKLGIEFDTKLIIISNIKQPKYAKRNNAVNFISGLYSSLVVNYKVDNIELGAKQARANIL